MSSKDVLRAGLPQYVRNNIVEDEYSVSVQCLSNTSSHLDVIDRDLACDLTIHVT